MGFLYFLEGIRIPILNEFMLLITQLGEETAFLAVALVLFWCIDKKFGYYMLSVGFLGTLSNQFLKLSFRIPRPWILDENFTIVEAAREAASGYSFPSGHTQSAVGTFGAIAYNTKNKWIRVVSIAIAVLVPFSRMYLGVHTPMDVLVAAAIAIVLIFVLRQVVYKNAGSYIPVLLGLMTVLSVGYLCFVEFYPFPSNIDQHNLSSGIKNAYTLFGALIGFLAVYAVDEKVVNFPTQATWWAQILKVVGGLILVLIVKSVLKTPINALFGASIGTAVRYCLIVIIAGILWPLTFKWFSTLGHKS